MSNIPRSLSHANDGGREDEPKTPTGTWPANSPHSTESLSPPAQSYQLYKGRFFGLSALNNLGVMAASAVGWYATITVALTTHFGFTPKQINMLSNASASMYFPSCICVPWLVSKYGLRRCSDIGAVIIVTAAWMRYASTARGLPNTAAYAILMISQLLSVVSISIFLVLGPKFSESWFNLKGRTTATALLGTSYFMGQGTGPLMAPWFKNTSIYILTLAILSSVVSAASVFKLHSEPPTPPTYAASQKSRSLKSLLLNLIGKPESSNVDVHPPMTRGERLDFMIIMHIFSVFVAAFITYLSLASRYLIPYGYSVEMIKHMGIALLSSGLVGALVSATLLDRVFKRHLAVALKMSVSILAATWLSLPWAIQADNMVILVIIFSVIGLCSMALLPIALELAVEVTRAPVASAALLWGIAWLVSQLFIQVENVLQAGPHASPPMNMRNGLVFQTACVCVSALFVIPLKGRQKRRKMDERAGKPFVGISVQSSTTEVRDDTEKDIMEMIELESK